VQVGALRVTDVELTRSILGKSLNITARNNVINQRKLLYRLECWTLTEKLTRRKKTAYMRSLKGAAGYRITNHKRNGDITEEEGKHV
jgi:hypothetical protein